MSFKSRLMLASLCVPAFLTANSALALDTKPVLSLDVAKKMADGCEAKSKAEGWKMVISVVDDGGNLKYHSRMDGAFLVSVKIAQGKAETSARVPVPSRKWGEFAQSVKGLDLVPGMVSFAGGLPIMTAGGVHIGGIGVSGGSADQDEVCAQAGLDA
ncbi:MAG: heme-binding protein, partial [Burkholderiales bacterium]|nr:heme-binding protein [Burkholderiales bacterium]